MRFGKAATLVFGAALATSGSVSELRAAEYGTGPWVKGYTDIFGGVIPSQPGFYLRTDGYHYEGSADTTIFDGRVAINVDEQYTATLFALSYVTPWKILGGTYAVAYVPSVVAMNVDVGVALPSFTGPRGRTIRPLDINTGGSELAQGDTAFAPVLLGWNAGNFHWNIGVFGFAPTGEYSKNDFANTSLNHWAIMTRLAGTWFDPKTGWQASGAAIYSVNWENPATDYETGNILNLEGAVTKNFGPLGVGVVSYAMIQTTGDSGSGARLGSFESRVYGVGPIVSFTTSADPTKALTVLVKWYSEFDAEHTFEGNTVDVAASFKF
jgi:hypothetical protein